MLQQQVSHHQIEFQVRLRETPTWSYRSSTSRGLSHLSVVWRTTGSIVLCKKDQSRELNETYRRANGSYLLSEPFAEWNFPSPPLSGRWSTTMTKVDKWKRKRLRTTHMWNTKKCVQVAESTLSLRQAGVDHLGATMGEYERTHFFNTLTRFTPPYNQHARNREGSATTESTIGSRHLKRQLYLDDVCTQLLSVYPRSYFGSIFHIPALLFKRTRESSTFVNLI